MSDFQKGTPRAKTMLNDYNQPHPETEQPMPGGKFNGAMRFEQKGNGKIVLRLHDGVWTTEKKTTREVELDYMERGALFDAVLQAADEKSPFASVNIPVNQKGWVRGPTGSKPTDTPINMCNLIVSREPDGRVSLEYVKNDYRFKVVFRLKNVASYKIKMPDGTVKDDVGMPSRSSARSWSNWHAPLLNQMEREAWTPRETKPFNGGGQGGGNGGGQWQQRNNGSNGGNGGNGGNKPIEEEFDTIEW